MKPEHSTKVKKGKSHKSKKKVNGILDNVKSKFILKQIICLLPDKKFMKIIQYNKNMQHKLDLSINDYKRFYQIELEIITVPNNYGKFINVTEGEDSNYQFFFNNKKNEINRNYLKENENVQKIIVILDYQISSFYNLFNGCECIESISFKFFYTEYIINMKNMFYGCTFLKTVNFLSFNSENVTDMSYMFYNCSSLKELNLSNFNTNKVTDMCSMFNGCSSLKEINLSSFNTENVIDMSNMFYDCSSLKELNLSNFNTNKLIYLFDCFKCCSSLKNINLSGFNTRNIITMKNLFYGCSSLKELDLSNFNTENVTNMSYMFYNCSSLKKIDISKFNTNKVTTVSYMFYGCSSLTGLIFPGNTINFYNIRSNGMEGVCDKCTKLVCSSYFVYRPMERKILIISV